MLVDSVPNRACWALPVVKVVPGVKFRLVLGGTRWILFGSHWLDRLYLCTGSDCPGCVYGRSRVMGFRVAAWCPPLRPTALLVEAPFSSIARLDGLCLMDDLRVDDQLLVEASRTHSRSAIRLEPLSQATDEERTNLTDIHTLNAVAVLFGLPELASDEDHVAWADRIRPVAHARLSAALVLRG